MAAICQIRRAIRSVGRVILAPPAFDELAIVRAVLPARPGVLVDVGAHNGSSMRPFVAAGWLVYAFEPEPRQRQRLERDPMVRSGRVLVDPRAITERDGESLPLYTSPESSGIATLSPFRPTHRASATVSTIRLDTYLKEHEVREVTVLKTDTEGHDLPVLRTYPWELLRPTAVVAEFENRKTLQVGYRYEDLVDFLIARNYAVFVSEWYPVQAYGGPTHRWRSFRRAPSPLVDAAAWGNVIAIQADLSPRLVKAARRARLTRELTLVRLRRWVRAKLAIGSSG